MVSVEFLPSQTIVNQLFPAWYFSQNQAVSLFQRSGESNPHTYILLLGLLLLSLYTGISQLSLSRLQLVLNVEARLLTGTWKRDQILASFHWLPVQFRGDFKVLLFVYKALNALNCRPSNSLFYLQVPQVGWLWAPGWFKLRLRDNHAFEVAASRMWNSIPPRIRSAPSIDSLKTRLKTYFYSLVFEFSWCGWFLGCA